MNVLLVDDQRAIVESIKKGIGWEKLGIEEVYTACSAAKAKLFLVNASIDIMLLDIEMPGEDGLSLFQWVKEKGMNVCCIFLTSHADFEYARRAIGLGGFDYILQPARYQDVEKVLERACRSVSENRRIEQMYKTQKELVQQRDIWLAAIIGQVNQRDFQEAERTLDKLTELLRMEREKTWLYSAQFVPGTCGGYESWTNELRSFFHHNLLEEIYAEATVCVAPGNGLTQNLLLLACKDGMDDKKWEEGLKIYCRFIDGFLKTDCHVYAAKGMALNGLAGRPDIFAPYLQPEKAGESCLSGIIWEEEEQESAEDENDRRMEMVIDYIRTHLYKNISRSEAAQMACLSEEYFSRVFKSYTGWTFKDFVLKEKMKLAGQLLSNSVLPVGVIASKLGFDNFSHFSQVFKKISGCTPQEYRKRHKDE